MHTRRHTHTHTHAHARTRTRTHARARVVRARRACGASTVVWSSHVQAVERQVEAGARPSSYGRLGRFRRANNPRSVSATPTARERTRVATRRISVGAATRGTRGANGRDDAKVAARGRVVAPPDNTAGRRRWNGCRRGAVSEQGLALLRATTTYSRSMPHTDRVREAQSRRRGIQVSQNVRVCGRRGTTLVDSVQSFGRCAARIRARFEQAAFAQDCGDELCAQKAPKEWEGLTRSMTGISKMDIRRACAEEAAVIALAWPEQRPCHPGVTERFAHAVRLGKAQHAVHRHFGTAQTLVNVVWAPTGALNQLDANLIGSERGGIEQRTARERGRVRARAWSLNTRHTLLIIPLLPGSSAQHTRTTVCVCMDKKCGLRGAHYPRWQSPRGSMRSSVPLRPPHLRMALSTIDSQFGSI